MNSQFDNIFCIPVFNNFLVYSPLNGISALLNNQGIEELKKHLKIIEKGTPANESKFYELANDILTTPHIRIARKKEKLNPDFLGIIPTRACNGTCNYCDFGADKFENDAMSYNMAVHAVDWYTQLMLKHNGKVLEVHFFGGEPMVAFDVIEVAVHRARLQSMKNDLFPFFEISTNGQYSEEKAKWLGNYFNKVVLSFDGFPEIQNSHRPLKGGQSSYENVYRTAKIISDSNAELCIRCCISQLNIDKMEQITQWFCENFRLSALNFEILSESEITSKNGLYSPDPLEFAVHFQKSRTIAKSYGIDVVYASDIVSNPQVSSCPVGKDTAIVSPDGRISNCYLLQEQWQKVNLNLNFGIVKSDGEVSLNTDNINGIRAMVEDKPRCETCFCKWSCSGGCHVGTTFPGCTSSYNDFCRQTRLISLFSLMNEMDLHQEVLFLLNNTNMLNEIANRTSDKLINYIE